MFEHALLGELLGDEAVSTAFSGEAFLAHFCQFEIALTDALGAQGLIDNKSASAIIAGCRSFKPDMQKIRTETVIDGLAVPAFVRELKTHIGDPNQTDVHFGATSQDLLDTALALSLKGINKKFALDISALNEFLQSLIHAYGQNGMMGRTRMQAALPISVSDRVRAWQAPLERHLIRLEKIDSAICVLQLGGAVGTNHVFGEKAVAIADDMAASLELGNPAKQWHTERDNLVEYANWLSMVTGTLGKMGQDFCLMAQQGIDDVVLKGGGSSSAMPHKQNPIAAETLVTLARFNAVQVSAMHQALVHEQERSGSAWALEWMILPNMCEATACALKTANRLTGQVSGMGHAC
ncbi:3-carboxy-cis,cis-muconate cycloisomerase [Pararhizobium sp. IMCC21322]|uniref:3-carboxy-cis,cis-muconate cycloisomerase n=1 Tax=Pararhizobium sp. IMCC21322 TaxID=3067903 RepID=UPI0027420E3A|nr:3-carboxy-cis,cis-muconate cycloisomerase [Pararhizobium sp. IMCC21322]